MAFTRFTWWAAALAAFAACPMAHATDGYFQHGYGLKAQGMGGAATATADDAMGGANNPASMFFAGNRVDAGLLAFSPRRSAARSGDPFGPEGAADSGRNYFPVPSFGYNRVLDDRLALGVTVYANGGMDTDYPGGAVAADHCGVGAPRSNLLCGAGRLGVNLEQVVVAPTLAVRVGTHQSIGVAPLIAYQRFKAYGLQAFAGMSSAPDALTNRGTDTSTGIGVRVGWFDRINDRLSVGASYAPRLRMGRFRRYRGLFADGGSFDLPANFSLGVAVRPDPRLLLALDYQRIDYAGVPSVGRPSTVQAPLGGVGGPGFGWRNVNVFKLGAAWRLDRRWTLRAGFNRVDNPVRAADVTFNILAPGVVQNHATIGFTYHTDGAGDLTVAYTHAFSNSVRGTSLLDPASTETIRMHEDSLGVGYGWRL